MIPLGILTKHKPGELPRIGPTWSPTESGSISYPFANLFSFCVPIRPLLSISLFTCRSSPVLVAQSSSWLRFGACCNWRRRFPARGR